MAIEMEKIKKKDSWMKKIIGEIVSQAVLYI